MIAEATERATEQTVLNQLAQEETKQNIIEQAKKRYPVKLRLTIQRKRNHQSTQRLTRKLPKQTSKSH
jgi:hypothetical protein